MSQTQIQTQTQTPKFVELLEGRIAILKNYKLLRFSQLARMYEEKVDTPLEFEDEVEGVKIKVVKKRPKAVKAIYIPEDAVLAVLYGLNVVWGEGEVFYKEELREGVEKFRKYTYYVKTYYYKHGNTIIKLLEDSHIPAGNRRMKIAVYECNGNVCVEGETYHVKDILKKELNARWDSEKRVWVIRVPETYLPGVYCGKVQRFLKNNGAEIVDVEELRKDEEVKVEGKIKVRIHRIARIGNVAIEGNTYPIRNLLKKLGAIWEIDEKRWVIPEEKAEEVKKALEEHGVEVELK